ncbi:MAG: hypothetical protein RR945_11025 [Erysipelotrichaceae bacterium]
MENLIRSVIEADKEARLRVEEARNEKYNIQSLINEKRKDVEKKYQEEFNHKVEENRKALEATLLQEEKQQQDSYDKHEKALEQTYVKNKEEWIASIIKNCIEA